MNEKKYAMLYIVSVLLITWSVTVLLFINTQTGLKFFALIMFIPGVLAFIFNIFQYRSKKKLYECFVKKMNRKAVIFGILYPIVFVIVCAIIAYITGMAAFHKDAYIEGIGQLTQDKVLVIRDSLVLIIAALLAIPSALGEEYGWRGYLLPKLTNIYGMTKATVIVGFVWGIFHIPAVYLLAKATGLENPVLLCIVQASAAFTFSFPEAYCFYLSKNIMPAVFLHAVWNTINVMVLGDIYENEFGILKGNLININGEGVLGVILGMFLICWFVWKFHKNEEFTD